MALNKYQVMICFAAVIVKYVALRLYVMFTGMSGPVMIDSKGNRVPFFVFNNIQNSIGSTLLELDSRGTVVTPSHVSAVWPGGSTKVPDDEPECVFDAETCKGRKRASKLFDYTLANDAGLARVKFMI